MKAQNVEKTLNRKPTMRSSFDAITNDRALFGTALVM